MLHRFYMLESRPRNAYGLVCHSCQNAPRNTKECKTPSLSSLLQPLPVFFSYHPIPPAPTHLPRLHSAAVSMIIVAFKRKTFSLSHPAFLETDVESLAAVWGNAQGSGVVQSSCWNLGSGSCGWNPHLILDVQYLSIGGARSVQPTAATKALDKCFAQRCWHISSK